MSLKSELGRDANHGQYEPELSKKILWCIYFHSSQTVSGTTLVHLSFTAIRPNHGRLNMA